MKRWLRRTLGTLSCMGLSLAQASQPLPTGPTPSLPAPQNVQVLPPAESAPPQHGEVIYPDHGAAHEEHVTGDCCTPPPPKKPCWKVYGGGEGLYLRPQFSPENPALFTITLNNNVAIGAGANGLPQAQLNNFSNGTSQDFSYDFSVSGRAWLGIQNDSGLGVRGRGFYFDQSPGTVSGIGGSSGTTTPPVVGLPGGLPNNMQTIITSAPALGLAITTSAPSTNTPVAGGPTTFLPGSDTLFANSSLFMNVIDGELTQNFTAGNWQLIVSAGGRYAYIEQTYSAFHAGAVRTDTVAGVVTARDQTTDSLESRQTFTGGGPAVGLEVIRRLGCSNFGLYTNARGSLLFGRSRQNVIQNSRIQSDVIVAGATLATVDNSVITTAQASSFNVLPILELEAGAQWAAPLGNLEFVIRPAAIGQVYFDAGNATTRDGNLGLFGFMLSAGVRF